MIGFKEDSCTSGSSYGNPLDKIPPPVLYLLLFLGASLLLNIVVSFSHAVYVLFLRRSSLLTLRHPTKPTYALVTGATAGIGLQIAHSLASRGFSVILHGRNPAKLERCSAAVRETAEVAAAKGRGYGAGGKQVPDVRTLCCPSSDFDSDKDIARLAGELAELNLRVLINNVGGIAGIFDYPHYEHGELTAAQLDALLDVNLRFTMHVTRALIPQLIAPYPDADGFRPRPRAAIVNCSSAAQVGIPWVATYSATKGALDSFSRAMQREFNFTDGLRGGMIAVMSARIGPTGEAGGIKGGTWDVPTARVLADSLLWSGAIGNGRNVVVPTYWGHAVLCTLENWAPSFILERAIESKLKAVKDDIQAGLKKE